MSTVPEKSRQAQYPRRKRQRLILWTLCILGLIIALPFLNGVRLHLKLHRELEKIRAAGEPVTGAELARYAAAPPEALEAAKAYQKAFDAMPEEEKNDAENEFDRAMDARPKHGRYSESLLNMLRNQLAKNAGCVRLLHEAVQGTPARFYTDWEQGMNAEMLHLAKLPHSARLLGWEAVLAAHGGDTETATRNIAEIFTIADTIREEPSPISQLKGGTCRSIGAAGLNRIVEIADLTDAQLIALGHAIRAAETPEAVTRALVGDRAMVLANLTPPAVFEVPEEEETVTAALRVKTLYALGYFANDLLQYLDMINPLIDAARRPIHECVADARKIEAELTAKTAPSTAGLCMILGPAMTRIPKTIARNIAIFRTAYAGTAIQRYKLNNGTLPLRLSDLAPEFLDAVPEDPFDGQPLRYKAFENGYVVDSIGENGADDGGDESRVPSMGCKDICFRVER